MIRTPNGINSRIDRPLRSSLLFELAVGGSGLLAFNDLFLGLKLMFRHGTGFGGPKPRSPNHPVAFVAARPSGERKWESTPLVNNQAT
jgi:hypothetical protein